MSSLNALSNLDDQELLLRISAGNEEAFKELYTRYHLPIFNYILRLVHQVQAAEDILQDVFLAIWQSANRFRGHSSVKTWMFRIAHNQAVSWLRRRKNSDQVIDNIENFSLLSKDLPPEEKLLQEWQSNRVQSALEKLSPNHRSVVELTFVHGFAYREIAEIMRCPVGTVKSRMSYALKNLSAYLTQTEE